MTPMQYLQEAIKGKISTTTIMNLDQTHWDEDEKLLARALKDLPKISAETVWLYTKSKKSLGMYMEIIDNVDYDDLIDRIRNSNSD